MPTEAPTVREVCPKVRALVERRDHLLDQLEEVKSSHMPMKAEDTGIKWLTERLDRVYAEARKMRPKNEAELRDLEEAGFLAPSPHTIPEGDATFDVISMSPKVMRPLNFDSIGQRRRLKTGGAYSASYDDYSAESMP